VAAPFHQQDEASNLAAGANLAVDLEERLTL
jgi:hypothetical protein